MMSFAPPREIVAREFTRMPKRFRRDGKRTEWADYNRGGQAVGCFLEGPCFDRAGNLHVVDIPFGRIFSISSAGAWSLIAEYDGWPNGMKLHPDGRRFVIADYKRGIMALDPGSGRVTPLVETYRSEGFKGPNDLHVAPNGDLYFTDQGQTGLHDPTGRVYRLSARGRLDCLIDTVPSPNGLVLNKAGSQLLVAVTRANAIWRLPLMADGGVSKVGIFIQLSGGLGGPDGLALDEDDNLAVCHLGLGVFLFDRVGRPLVHVKPPGAGLTTNLAYGGPEGRTIYVTESETGAILTAEMPVRGRVASGGGRRGRGRSGVRPRD